jgi:hypothetical protein
LARAGVLPECGWWQAEHLFTPAQYEAALGFVLDRCKVDSARLQQTLALSKAVSEDKKVCLSLSRMTVIQGRPRLRDRVSTLLKTDERKAQVLLVFRGFEWV